MSRLRCTVLAATVLLALPAVVMAAPEPQSTSATYDAWTLRCATPPAAPSADAKGAAKPAASPATPQPVVRQCEIVESVQIQGQPAPVVQLAVGAPEPGGPLRLVVQVPPGAWLPSNVTIQIGEKSEPVTLVFKRCLPGACVADTELSDALREAMRSQQGAGKVTFRLAADKDIAVPISLKGFAAALDALTAGAK